MSTNVQRQDFSTPPPTLDEGYWSSLLNEGEGVKSVSEELVIHQDGPASDHAVDAALENYIRDNDENPVDADWEDIIRIASNDEVVDLKVIGHNRGGLLVEWRSLRGFVPASQLVSFPATTNPAVRRTLLMERLGQTLTLRVIELNPEKNRLILSERAAQAEPGERMDILTRLKSGDIIEGQVTNLCDFGVFVDLGGLEGLIHISELSWGRVGHPSQILQRGERVKAYVLAVDRDASRIALSIKRLRPDPWKSVAERYRIGEIVEGEITNVVDFGAFACLEEGLEGLIHVSELAEGHFLHPRNVVSEGQIVRARILSIDGQARRLGLTLRLTP